MSAGMWRSWRMCLGAVPLKPHAFTLSTLELNMPKRWICSGWCRRPKQQNRTESAFCPELHGYSCYISVCIHNLTSVAKENQEFSRFTCKNQGRQLSDVCRPVSPCPYVRFSCRSFERLFCVFERKLPDSKVTKLFRSTFLSINSGQKADSVH